ncbi:hypothetical protein [Stenotrophomonas muris]|uniref:hypothetical protein n=1 Tax=Stenotrophomonas muris TaxID=2963283 RepID=UPI0039C5E99C
MFEFFRAKPAEHEKAGGLFVNDGYWAEKCVANDGDKKEFSSRLFRDLVTRLFKEHVEGRVDPDDLADPDSSTPEWVARLWQELEREVLNDSEDHDALSNAISAMSDFEPQDPDYSDFRITDAWEYASSLQQYTFHFIWRLYAIARAIRAYDDAAGAAEPSHVPSARGLSRGTSPANLRPVRFVTLKQFETLTGQPAAGRQRRLNGSGAGPGRA